MTHRNKKLIACLLAALLCVALCACERQEQPPQTNPTAATQKGKPILPMATAPKQEGTTDTPTYTPVYVTVFEDVALLATVPVEEWGDMTLNDELLDDEMLDIEEDVCPPREISQGGRISCNGEHERETPITKVLILERIAPRDCGNWFRDLLHLESIQGLEKLDIQFVTNMSFMFAGCERLTELDIDDWDVTGVEDMTGMFDGCVALDPKPEWYTDNN